MKNNPLYTFIDKEPTVHKTTFEMKRLKKKAHYAMHSLDVKSTGYDGDPLTLTEHHISIHKDYSTTQSLFSQYHYTAIFESTDGENFQLHVYFDGRDKASHLVYSQKNKQGIYTEVVIPSEQMEYFKILATTEATPIISRLRKHKNDFIENLEQQYEQIEEAMCQLSTDISLNFDAYLLKTQQITKILQKLAAYHDNSTYASILKHFENLYRNLKLPTPIETTTTTNPTETTNSGHALTIAPVATPATKPKVKEEIFAQLTKEAELAKNKFLESSHLSIEQQVDLLTRIPIGYINPNHPTIKRLVKIIVLDSKYHYLAEKLSHLLNPAPIQLIRFALSENDAGLLDLLLKIGAFPINTSAICDDLNAVQYCFLNDNNGNKAKCLEVLINHGASLMVDDKNHRPIAHAIISKVNHPFNLVLVATGVSRTPSFCRDLIRKLKVILMSECCDESEKDILVQYINIYQMNRVSNAPKSTVMEQSSKKALNALANCNHHFNTAVLERLQRDPDVLSHLAIRSALYDNYMEGKSSVQKINANRLAEEYFTDLNELLATLDLSKLSFNDIKAGKMHHLKIEIKIFENLIQLDKVQKELSKPRLKTHSPKIANLVSRERGLIDNINSLRNEIIINANDIKYDMKYTMESEILTGLERIQSSLESLSNSLQNFQASSSVANNSASLFGSSTSEKVANEANSNLVPGTLTGLTERRA